MGRTNPQQNIHRRWLAVATTVLSGLPLAGAYTVQVFLNWRLPAWLFVTLLTVGVAATIGSALVQTNQARRQQNSLEAIKKMRNAFVAALPSYLTPLADIKSRLVNAEDD